MSRVIFLDSGPLWLAVMGEKEPAGEACRDWLLSLETSGAEVVIPAVADYEVRRELFLRGASTRLHRLEAIRSRFDYLPVSEAAWDRAAELWAFLRKKGTPTSGKENLDVDAIIAAQVLTSGQPGDSLTIATTNVRHLVRFTGIVARVWDQILN